MDPVLQHEFDSIDNLSQALGTDYVLGHIKNTVDYAFQPIVDLGTGVVYAYEALVRNLSPLGLKGPEDLFDFAHESGFLPALELQLYRKALAKFCRLSMARGTKLFFNIDGRDLGIGDDPRMQLHTVATEFGVTPGQVCLELSERHKDAYSDITEHALSNLRQAGFLLALDDFGRGFSDLRLLHDTSPDHVKIDRFFLHGIDADPRRKMFVTTVTNLAHVLGARVVAEGVETEREFRACRDAGCDLIQGYFIAKPLLEPNGSKLFYDHIRSSYNGKPQEEDSRIRAELLELPTITFDSSMRDLLDLFMSDQEISVVPVVDSNNEPRGLIHERDLKAYLYAGGSDEDDYHDALDLPLRSFVRSCPIADIDSNADMLLVTFASSLNSDGILITQNFRYAGFLSATSLLKIIHEKRLEEAKDQNPLSRLPGNTAVGRFLMEAALPRPAARHMCYIDFDNFKPFNDTYGYRQGDRAIILFSELLQRFVTGTDTFRGHIGGDDFFAGFLSGDQTNIASQMLSLKRAFKSDVESFYDPEHRDSGYMEALDRFGSNRKFKLLDCSISIVTLPPGISMHPDRLNEEIAMLKHEAKRSDDGLVVKTLESSDA